MKTWMKAAAALFGAAAFFVGGYRYAAALYGEDIAALREDYASRALRLEEEYREKDQIRVESLRRAWEERDAAYAEADALGAELDASLDRLRDENAALRRRLSGAGEGACAPCRAALGECTRLLDESSELLREGVEVRLKDAGDIDAIRRVTGG